MNIAILGSRGFPSTYSGYETLVRHLAAYLVKKDHEVTVYSREPTSKGRVWKVDGVRCISTPGLNSKSLSTPSFGLTSTIDASFRRFDAALVVNIANGFWLPLLRASRIPSAVNTDGIEWERGKWNRLAKRIFKSGAICTAKFANLLIADSQAIAEIWERDFRRSSVFIPYGAPVLNSVGKDKLDAVGLRDQPYVLSVARLVPENNVDLMLDACENIPNSGVSVVVVGSGVGRTPLEERLRDLATTGDVKWLGHVHDQELLAQLQAHCTAYVHGHSVGGTNPSLLQALGAGAPVLALNTRFNAEVIENDDQLFDPVANQLTEKIETLISSASMRAQFISEGRRIVAERYSWDEVCHSYLSNLEDLVSGS